MRRRIPLRASSAAAGRNETPYFPPRHAASLGRNV
jgi:hypothetical protein